MCLAIPMRIIEVGPDGFGVVALEEIRQRVELSLVEHPMCGEYVIVHAGFAIEKLNVVEAEIRLKLFDDLAQHHLRETSEEICWVPVTGHGGDAQ